MKKKRLVLLTICTLMFFILGCNDDDNDKKTNTDPSEPAFKASNFSNPTTIDNMYLPMTPGTYQLYQVETEDGVETIATEVLEETRMVAGVCKKGLSLLGLRQHLAEGQFFAQSLEVS